MTPRPPLTGAILPLLAVAAGIAAPAAAANKTADVGLYCRQLYGQMAVPSTNRRDDSLACLRPIRRGPGLELRKIKAAEVCAKQFGTRRFHREGIRVTCITGTAVAAPAVRKIDLANYCRRRYGREAFLTTRRADGRPMCGVPVPGGHRLHLIDLANLCRGGTPRVADNTLHCAPQTAAAPQPSTKGPGTNSPGRNRPGATTKPGSSRPDAPGARPSGPPPEAKRVGGGRIRQQDFRGCGGPHLLVKLKKRSPQNIIAAMRGWVPVSRRKLFRCLGLKRGRTVDLARYCRSEGRRRGGGVHLFWRPDGYAVCSRSTSEERPQNMTPIQAPVVCQWASRVVPRRKGRRVFWPYAVATRTAGRRLTCFYFTWERWYAIWIPPERIEFVSAKPPRRVLNRLDPGQRFRVRLVYKDRVREEVRRQPVILRQRKSGVRLELVAKRIDDSNAFETRVLRVRKR